MNHRLISLAVALASLGCFGGADWLQFRGNHCNGVADESNPPTTLDNVAWSVELQGRGLSSPVIVGDRVVVTSNSGIQQDRLHITCLDEASGNELWVRQFWATGQTSCNSTISMATPSPASDGRRIFAFYSCNDLACLDFDGNLLWYRGLTHDYPTASNSLGMSSSPVVSGDTVVVQMETDDGSLALGLDTATGVTRWKLDRIQKANWSSPTVLKGNSGAGDLFILQSANGIDAIEPATGKVVWSFGGNASSIPSVTVGDNVVYVPRTNLTAVEPAKTGTKGKALWEEARLSPKTSSPAVYNDRIYMLNDAGILNCAEVKTGKIIWRQRLKGPFTSSPITAADHLYAFSEEGLGQVVKLHDKRGEIVATRNFEEKIFGTPSMSDDALYVRSDKHLWKIVK